MNQKKAKKPIAVTSERHGSSGLEPSDDSLEKAAATHNTLAAMPTVELGEKGTVERPLEGYDEAQLRQMGIEYAWKLDLDAAEDRRAFELGAVLAQDPQDLVRAESLAGMPEADRLCLMKEGRNRWSQKTLMYCVIVICSICAAIQVGVLSSHACLSSCADRASQGMGKSS